MINIKKIVFFTFIVIFIFSKGIAFNSIAYNIKDTIANDYGPFVFNDDFFSKDSLLKITLKLDLRSFFKNKKQEKNVAAELFCINNDSINYSLKAKVKSRGVYRRDLCAFPSYWLKLDIPDESPGVDGKITFNKAKVVSHCINSKSFKEYLLREYLAYKILNILTDNSFRVRLLHVNYVDSENIKDTLKQYAFIIEPEELLANRLNSYPIKRNDLLHVQMDSMLVTTMSLFQYMIGNTDYSIAGRHNVKIFKSKDHLQLYLTPVPYDFDFSGLVNTYYAIPSPKTGLKSVTERYFYGLCKSDETFNVVITQFQNKKNEIKNYILSFPYLDEKVRESVWEYIEEFYNETENENFINKKIRSTCKQ